MGHGRRIFASDYRSVRIGGVVDDQQVFRSRGRGFAEQHRKGVTTQELVNGPGPSDGVVPVPGRVWPSGGQFEVLGVRPHWKVTTVEAIAVLDLESDGESFSVTSAKEQPEVEHCAVSEGLRRPGGRVLEVSFEHFDDPNGQDLGQHACEPPVIRQEGAEEVQRQRLARQLPWDPWQKTGALTYRVPVRH